MMAVFPIPYLHMAESVARSGALKGGCVDTPAITRVGYEPRSFDIKVLK